MISWPQGEYTTSPINTLTPTTDDVLARPATSSPSSTSPSSQQNSLPIVIVASAGGGVLLLLTSLLVAFLLIRRKRKRDKKVFLRGRPSKISPAVGGARGDIPLRYASNVMITVEGPGSRPSLSKSNRPLPQIPRSVIPFQEGGATMSEPARPIGIHERYASPYTASALEKVYEILERNVTSPIPSYISGHTDGTESRVASPQPSSDLNHGRSFRSFDRPPPGPTPKPLLSQAFDAPNSGRPGTSGSTRSRTPNSMEHLRRPSEVRRTELLAALWSTDVVAVVGRPCLSSRPSTASRPSTGSSARTVVRGRYMPL